MLRAFYKTFRTYRSLHRIVQPKIAIKHLSRAVKVSLSTEIYSLVKDNKEEIEEILLQAQLQGKEAYIELVNVLKTFILENCKEYQKCVKQQIEITEQANILGPLSQKWGELPEYRTLAKDLSYELSIYVTLFRSIGNIIKDNKELREVVFKVYKDFERILDKELDINKKLDGELLNLNCDSILKDSLGFCDHEFPEREYRED
ncbi:unnamed protein product [Brassicogethes aeneus]|uniref:Uncharacterized protein n=1 Tax=Brassicogethes aeneus TaxID=1431903 RepID=A0A9P0B7K1_BRAAE|nr:unnamed protein product [Brassicogethes aeneus]